MWSTLELQPCIAPPWARGGNAQTLWRHCLPATQLLMPSEKQLLALPDGDHLVLLHSPGRSDWVIYLFHGLSGDASSSYMTHIAKHCIDHGHSVYRVNHRGCGEGVELARQPYHSGRGEDISAVIAKGRRDHPGKQHIAVGFSLSGNALLTLLTGLKGTVLPDYAISVNAPIDLAAASDKLKGGMNRLYDLYFVQRLRQAVAMKYHLGHLPNKVAISRLSTLRHFDALYTVPAGGFESVDDYYHSCSTHRHLPKVTIPTLLLTANDDPFIPVESYRQATLSPSTHLHIERVGGHLGYLTRYKTPLGNHRWLDYALWQYLHAVINRV